MSRDFYFRLKSNSMTSYWLDNYRKNLRRCFGKGENKKDGGDL